MWVLVLFTFILTYIIYYCCFKPYNYWKNRGILYEIPLPVVGNFGETVFKRKHVAEVYNYLYNKYSSERYVGIYIFMKPVLLVRDLDLIRKICVEDFDHFSNRVGIFDKKYDDILGNNLVSLKDKEWKETRSALNFAFCDSVIEKMFDQMSNCAETFTNYFVKENKELLEIQLNDVFSRYDCDVLSRICFDKVTDSLEDKQNDYIAAYNSLRNFGVWERLKLSLIQLCPLLAKILQTKVLATSKTDFYKKLVGAAVSTYESENKTNGCLVNYILESNKNTLKQKNGKAKNEKSVDFEDDVSEIEYTTDFPKKEWKDEELTAHILMFLNSHIGFEAVVTAISFLAYELALNPSIQLKLQEEIDTVQSSEANVTYEAISQMKYLDCVVSETLRKWPPVYQVDRECVKNFFETDPSIPDDGKIVIEKNTAVIIPIMAIHRDPKYYPQPEKFSPERFNEENKGEILPGTYIPFGRGPRNCIGSKIALLEIKLVFFHLLYKFDLVPTENTKIRIEVSPTKFDVHGAINTFLGLKLRKVTNL